jgi:uncharacterized Ntn-hydrolase superfamily protein
MSDPFCRLSKLVHTYSIVAIDPETGDMGVAVQSHWFSVGTVVTWGEAGVGVVATQSMVNPSFGPNGLELIRGGLSPRAAMARLISADEGRDFRQLALLDSRGRVAAYTGCKCTQCAGHAVGEGYSVQANLMLNEKVWPAMSEAFGRSTGPLTERMLLALEAAEAAGGDIRGRQSAAMLVVRGRPTGNVWEDRLVDLRVEDHPEPLFELSRLLKVHRAYQHMNDGDLALEKGEMQEAMGQYSAAEELFPENEEMMFWHAVGLANSGRIKEALPLFRAAFRRNSNWKVLLPRLLPSGLLKIGSEDLRRIQRLR